MKKPSAKQYPEYYVVIRSPIDFREIVQKIKQEQVRLTVMYVYIENTMP